MGLKKEVLIFFQGFPLRQVLNQKRCANECKKEYILFEGPKAYLKHTRWKGLGIFISTKKQMWIRLYMWGFFCCC